jgi:hypothetical protein
MALLIFQVVSPIFPRKLPITPHPLLASSTTPPNNSSKQRNPSVTFPRRRRVNGIAQNLPENLENPHDALPSHMTVHFQRARVLRFLSLQVISLQFLKYQTTQPPETPTFVWTKTSTCQKGSVGITPVTHNMRNLIKIHRNVVSFPALSCIS